MKPLTCCNQPISTSEKDGMHYLWCKTCKRNGKGATPAEAETAFNNWTPPITAQGFAEYVHSKQEALYRRAAPFVRSDRSAFERMIQKNTEYIASLTGGRYDTVWNCEEGRESFARCLEESIEMGATLPDMGSVVPYGTTAELIPDVEAFRFACTTGSTAPFEWVNIEPRFEHDRCSIGKRLGDFFIDFEDIPADRGRLVGVAVYGKRSGTGKIDGEYFDLKTLDALARKFSKGYQTSMRDIDDFAKARGEGKVKVVDGREVIEKTVKGKDGKPDWTKRVYFDEIDCPYTSPATSAKMYSKLAGKSFLGPYMKVRNSAAAVAEVREAPTDHGDPNDWKWKNPDPVVNTPVQALAELAAASSVPEPTPVPAAKPKEKAPVTTTTNTATKKPTAPTLDAEGLF